MIPVLQSPFAARFSSRLQLPLVALAGSFLGLVLLSNLSDPIQAQDYRAETPSPSAGSQPRKVRPPGVVKGASRGGRAAPATSFSRHKDAPGLDVVIPAIDFDTVADENSGFFFVPPDVHGAVGPTHVLNVVNTSIEWFTKGGARQNSQPLGKADQTDDTINAFFAPLNPLSATFDPKAIYDEAASRFVVVTLERTDADGGDGDEGGVRPFPQAAGRSAAATDTSRILLAASDDSNPNGTWNYFAIDSKENIGGKDCWADYPGFASDASAIYVTANMFTFDTSSFMGVRVWVVPKSALYNGGQPVSKRFNPYAGGGQAVTTMPAQTYGSSDALYLAGYDGIQKGANDAIQVVKMANPLSDSPTFTISLADSGDIDDSTSPIINAPQPGSDVKISTNDRRALNAVWRKGFLYTCAATIGKGADSGQATAHWWKIDTSATPAVADQGSIGGEEISPGAFTFFPSIAVDAHQNVAVGFSAAGPNLFAGSYYTGCKKDAPAGIMQPPGTLAVGVDTYVRTFTTGSTGRNRWGDYTATVPDPTQAGSFWVYNEHALARGTAFGGEDGRWGTTWGRFTIEAPVTTTDAELTISDVTVQEPASGQTFAVFTVTLSKILSQNVSVRYQTLDGTAKGGFDFSPVQGVLIIPAGLNQMTISVPILSDNNVGEFRETFSVKLSQPVLAMIRDDIGVGTIIPEKSKGNVLGRAFHFVLDPNDPASGVMVRKGIPDVEVAMGTLSTTTLADGTFAFYGVPNGTYAVQPTKPGQDFTPSQRPVTINSNTIRDMNFKTFSITGRVYKVNLSTQVRVGLAGAQVFIKGVQRAVTDSNGFYEIRGLGTGAQALTVQFAGFTFPAKTVTLPTSGIQGVSPNGVAKFEGTRTSPSSASDDSSAGF